MNSVDNGMIRVRTLAHSYPLNSPSITECRSFSGRYAASRSATPPRWQSTGWPTATSGSTCAPSAARPSNARTTCESQSLFYESLHRTALNIPDFYRTPWVQTWPLTTIRNHWRFFYLWALNVQRANDHCWSWAYNWDDEKSKSKRFRQRVSRRPDRHDTLMWKMRYLDYGAL